MYDNVLYCTIERKYQAMYDEAIANSLVDATAIPTNYIRRRYTKILGNKKNNSRNHNDTLKRLKMGI